MKNIFLGLLILTASCFSQDFHWAGVGFIGDYSKRNELYKFSSKVFDEKNCDKQSCFEVYSRNLFKNKSIASGTVRLTQAVAGTNAIGIALGIGYERLIVDKTPSSTYTDKNILNTIVIFGNLLFMDLDTNKLLGAVPTFISYHTASKEILSDTELHDTIRKMLIGEKLDINFAKDSLVRASTYRLPSEKILRAQVTNVSVNSNAIKKMNITGRQADLLSMQMAQVFEGILMNESGIQMLPSSVGHLVGGKLKTRLSSGDRTIILPDTDVSIQITLDKVGAFSKPKDDGTGETVCHANRMTFQANDSFGDNIFTTSLKNTPCIFVRKGTTIDNIASYEKSIFSLLSKTAKALAKPSESDDFYESSAPKKVDLTESQFVKFKKLFI